MNRVGSKFMPEPTAGSGTGLVRASAAEARPIMTAVRRSVISGAGNLASWSRSGRKLSILIYHRVLDDFDPLRPDEVDSSRFKLQMEALAENFNVLPFGRAVTLLKQNRLPPRAVSITFDDGYADNASVALPILSHLGLSATFFIATGYLDGGRMWNDSVIEAIRLADSGKLELNSIGFGSLDLIDEQDRLRAILSLLEKLKYLPLSERNNSVESIVETIGKSLPSDLMMTTNQVRELSDAGMEIGAHTVHHPILSDLSDDDARLEIVESQMRLERITGSPVTTFAYPNGRPGQDYTRRDVELLRALGFQAAVSTAWGVGMPGADCWQLPRFTPWDRSKYAFAIRLLQNYGRTKPDVV